MLPDQTIRVLVVDDDAMVRVGLGAVLSSAPDIEVVGEAGDGAQAIDAAMRHYPDVVLMDIRMPVMDGIEATSRLRNMPRAPQVISLTSLDTDDAVFGSLDAGAAGFVLKDVAPRELCDAVRTVHGGDSFTSARATTRLIRSRGQGAESARQAQAAQDIAQLTAREREIALLVAEGRGNREIAEAVYLSEATVKSHILRITAKLDAPNRVGIAVTVALAGLLV